MAYTIDDYLKTNRAFQKSYDPNTNMATLTNTNTGKTLSFLSGQGQEYGLGGIQNGSNVISNLKKLQDYFNTPVKTENTTPTVPTLNTVTNTVNAQNNNQSNNYASQYDPKTLALLTKMQDRQYTSPYAQNITDALAKIQNYQNFNYNPTTDQGLQTAQDEAQSATSRAAARRGMLYSDSNKSQMGKSALTLVPQFRNQAYQEYSNDRANAYNQLQALQNLENVAYQKYQGEGTDLYNQANMLGNMANTDYNRYNTDRTYNEGVREFNVGQGNTDRQFQYNVNKDLGYVNPTAYVNVPDEVRQQLSQYSGNYAQAAKDLVAQGQTGLANYAKVLSNEKMFADPNLLKQYGSQYQTLDNQQVQSALQTQAIQRAGALIDNSMKQIQLDALPEQTQYGLQLLKYQVQAGELDNATKTIQNLYLPEQLKTQIAQGLQSIEASKANVSQGWASVNNAAGNLALNQAEFQAKKNAGAYDPEMYNLDKQIKKDTLESNKLDKTIQRLDSLFVAKVFDSKGNEVPKVVGDPTQMRTNILNLKLPDNETDYLLSRYGLPTK
jgi:hypothetical protein